MNLPNFMVIGAAKSATTTLYNILKQHDAIFTPTFKEPHFFNIDKNFNKGLAWYKKTYYSKANHHKAIFDFTPTYLYSSNCAERIYKNLGSEMKFIIVLRNPVDRAYSHYLHSKRDGHENSDFKSAISNEKNRIEISRKNKDLLSELRCSYLAQGKYCDMISTYLKYYPLNNFLIINFESEIVNNLEITIGKISNFLDLDLSNLELNFHSNKSGKSRFSFIQKLMLKNSFLREIVKFFFSPLNRQIIRNKIKNLNKVDYSFVPLSEELKKNLFKKYFMKDVLKLENLIGKSMNWNRL